MRLAFAGTPDFAAAALRALHAAGHQAVLVLTQPDRPAGRGLKLQASAVKLAAQALGLPLIQPRSLRLDGRWPEDAAQAREALAAAQPDVMVVAAYGLILPAWTLALPRHGCLNIHASLLPRWRGAAPIQRALQAGDAQTGITVMQMDAGLDTGGMLLSQAEPIHADDTAGALHERLARLGSQLIVTALQRLEQGDLPARPQPDEGVSYAHKIEKAEAAIHWSASAEQIERLLRAFDPFPGASFFCQGQTVKLWHAHAGSLPAGDTAPPGTVIAKTAHSLAVACGQGQLELLEVQLAGGRRLTIEQFLQTPLGRSLRPGELLGASGD